MSCSKVDIINSQTIYPSSEEVNNNFDKDMDNLKFKNSINEIKNNFDKTNNELKKARIENSRLLISENRAVSKYKKNKEDIKYLINSILELRSKDIHIGWGYKDNFYNSYDINKIKSISKRFLKELKTN